MEKKRKGTMLRLSEQDLQAVLKIRAYYGITSDNQAEHGTFAFLFHSSIKIV